MERPLARPHEVPGVGLFELGVSGLGEPQTLLRALAPAHVHRDGRNELQIVGMEPQDAEESGKAGEVAIDDLLQVGHPAQTPVFETLRSEQAHMDQHVHRSYNLAFGEQCPGGLHDSRIQLVVSVGVDTDPSAGIRNLFAHRLPV